MQPGRDPDALGLTRVRQDGRRVVDSTPHAPGPREAGTRPRRGLRLRRATFTDYDQIALLQSRNGLGKTPSYDEWSHLWLGNPVYRELGADWSIGWVLEDENNRIVGSVENIPLSYYFEGRRILAASGRGWVADIECRSASLVLLDCVINQPHVDLYLNSTFSVASAPAVSVFHCAPVPVGVWNESAFWITNHQGFLESFLARRGWPLAKPLSYPLSAATFVVERFTKLSGFRAGDVEIEQCPGFDDRFDDFWTELKARSQHLLLATRTHDVLQWHFKYALVNNRLWIATVVDGSRMVAYAIFDRRDRADVGLRRVRLVDYQSLDGSTALLLPLIGWALGKCRDERIHMLEHFGRWLERGELIDRVAPYRRTLPAWRYVYRAADARLAERLSDPRAWAPSLFDGDASLVR